MVRIPSVLTYTSLRSATDSDTAPGSFLLHHATGPTSACGNGANAAKTNHRYLAAVPGKYWVAWRIYPTVQYFLLTGIAPILGIAPVLIYSWSAVACRMDHKPTRSVVTHFPSTKREAQRHTVTQGGYYEK